MRPEIAVLDIQGQYRVYTEFYRADAAEKTIILVNGSLATTASFAQTVKSLYPQFNVVLYDQPYAGRSKIHNRHEQMLTKEVDRLLADSRALATGSAGVLRIGFHSSLATGELSEMMAVFRAANKEVEIDACEFNRRALLSAIERRHLDLAVTAGRACSSELQACSLWSEPLIAALPHGHPLAGSEQLHWADLRGEALVVSADDPGPDIRALINARLSSPGFAPDIRVQRVGRDNLLSFAEAGNIVLGTGFLVRRSPTAPVLHRIHDGFAATAIEQWLVWRTDNDSPPLRRFLAVMSERYRRPVGG